MSPEQTVLVALRRYGRATSGAGSPELVSDTHAVACVERPGSACDVWALGMVLAEVLGGTVAVAVAEYRRVIRGAAADTSDADTALRASVNVAQKMAAAARGIVDAVCATREGVDTGNNLDELGVLLGKCFASDTASAIRERI